MQAKPASRRVTELDERIETMNPALNARQQLLFQCVSSHSGRGKRLHSQSRRPGPREAKLGERATRRGRVAAGILLLFLVVSAVVSVVVNVHYGPVARQHAQVAVLSDIAGRVLPVTSTF